MIGIGVSLATIVVVVGVILWVARAEERDELLAHFDAQRARCAGCTAIAAAYPETGGFVLCDDCWDADLDAEFWAAVDAGMFEIPLEELSKLVPAAPPVPDEVRS